MEIVAGTFDSRGAAEAAVERIHSLGIRNDRIALLTPDMGERQIERGVPTTDTEAPGEGRALGGVVGGVIGVAGGVSLGAAAASLVIPGVGPVIAGGLLGAAILGAGGTAAGMAVGEALDASLVEGLPHDELYVYEHEVRKGRSVVIAFPEEADTAAQVRQIFNAARAINIGEARENWWKELRAVEEENYVSSGGDFQSDEPIYRSGFQAALRPKFRECQFDAEKMRELYGAVCDEKAFRAGYERGHGYQKRIAPR